MGILRNLAGVSMGILNIFLDFSMGILYNLRYGNIQKENLG